MRAKNCRRGLRHNHVLFHIEPGIEHKHHFTPNFQPTIALLTPTNHEDAEAPSDVDSLAILRLKKFMHLHSWWPLHPDLHTTHHKGFFIYIKCELRHVKLGCGLKEFKVRGCRTVQITCSFSHVFKKRL
jgi:hypothetical protein